MNWAFYICLNQLMHLNFIEVLSFNLSKRWNASVEFLMEEVKSFYLKYLWRSLSEQDFSYVMHVLWEKVVPWGGCVYFNISIIPYL